MVRKILLKYKQLDNLERFGVIFIATFIIPCLVCVAIDIAKNGSGF